MFLNENKDFNTELSEMDDKERVLQSPQYIRLDKEMQLVDTRQLISFSERKHMHWKTLTSIKLPRMMYFY